MKILLINPPLDNFNEDPYPSLGLGYIGAILETKGYEVKIIDSPIMSFTLNDIKNVIIKYNPDIVGITCVSLNYNDCINITKITKQINQTIKIIIGGPHVSFISDKVLQEIPWVDIIVIGEGENTILELVQLFESKKEYLSNIKGIAFRDKNGKIIKTNIRPFINNLDIIPFPARHLLPMEKYKNLTTYTSVITSRGCNNKCIYCNSSEFWKHKIRFRSALSINKELQFIKENYGINKIKFVDDLFLIKGKRTIELLKFIKKLEIEWICNARIDFLDQDLIENIAESGCKKIIFGIESLSQDVQKIIGKNLAININKIKNIIILCQKNNIKTKMNFIIGLPMQTKKDINNILDLIYESQPNEITINPLYPYPGTFIYNQTKNYFYNNYLNYHNKEEKNLSYNDIYLNHKDIRFYSTMINKLATSSGINVMNGY